MSAIIMMLNNSDADPVLFSTRSNFKQNIFPFRRSTQDQAKNTKYSTKKEEISQNPLPCSTAYFHAYEDVQEIDYGQTD